MPAFESLSEVIASVLESAPDAIDESVAEAVLDKIQVRGAAKRLLTPIVANHVADRRRAEVHVIERATRRGGVAVDALDARKRLLDQRFALGDGTFVLWGDATEEQHLQRIGFLTTSVVGLQRTIGLHEDAVEQIRTHGVSCLREIEEAA